MQLTYRYRIKDKHATRLRAQARAVNFIWNYCNETQMKAAHEGRKWLSGYDLCKLIAGCTRQGRSVVRWGGSSPSSGYNQSRRGKGSPKLRTRRSPRAQGGTDSPSAEDAA